MNYWFLTGSWRNGHPAIGLFVVGRYRQVRVCLVGRHSEHLADPATARPTATAWGIHVKRRSVVPDDILAAIDLCSAAAQHQIVTGRMIDMDLAVPMPRILIGRAVVACEAGRDGFWLDLWLLILFRKIPELR